jgi:hypothetical protein
MKQRSYQPATNVLQSNIYEVDLVWGLGPGGLVLVVYGIFKNAKMVKRRSVKQFSVDQLLRKEALYRAATNALEYHWFQSCWALVRRP